MFKKRKRKIEALDRAIARHSLAAVAVECDDDVDDVFKAEALKLLDEETEALISAAVAYETEPISVIAAVVITTMVWISVCAMIVVL